MAQNNTPYRVLARKYRPSNFDELIGQDALVRTLKNAISSGRIAHAFMLTGVRGVGKTTTARIIAKALNYTGPDGTSGPTTGPTDDCALCRAITEDRHPDVMEMDAASRTGVDDIREILDGVRYVPTEARYKIYVIDEVHMLSKNAFNALLKTLEEPPPHVKFIFATTEIRKVPVTILSRCQRFDLQRVSVETLCGHYSKICKLENVKADEEAITMIARAADGSVRDGLSLLDQAIAQGGEEITTQAVRNMLGLSESGKAFDLLESALTGEMATALNIIEGLYKSGAIPSVIIQDLLEITHLTTKIKAVPNIKGLEQFHSAEDLARAREIAGKLSMATLGKTWQLLLKGIAEVQESYNQQAAAEMILIRLVYAADLPDPTDLLKRLKDQQPQAGAVASAQASYSQQGHNSGAHNNPPAYANARYATVGGGGNNSSGGEPVAFAWPQLAPVAIISEQNIPTLKTIEDMIALLEANTEIMLSSQLYHFAHLVKLEHINSGENAHGRFELRLAENANPKFSQDLGMALKRITGQRWVVSLVNTGGEPTLAQKAEHARNLELEKALSEPLVKDILKVFPDARLVKIIQSDKNLEKIEGKNSND